jgi:PTS system mannose-specific IID component
MQTVGFAYALDPALRRIHGERSQQRQKALERHLGFYNTHPFMGAVLLGCVTRLEEDGKGERAVEVKRALMGPFGGIGDSFYWGALIPFLGAAALAAGWSGAAWAPWFLVGTFGGLGFATRLWMFFFGYRKGIEAAAEVQRLRLLLWSRRIKWAAALILGVTLSLALPAVLFDRWGTAVVGGAALTALAVSWLGRRGLSPAWIALAGAAVAVGLGFYLR